jgi:hypothetical protein
MAGIIQGSGLKPTQNLFRNHLFAEASAAQFGITGSATYSAGGGRANTKSGV